MKTVNFCLKTCGIPEYAGCHLVANSTVNATFGSLLAIGMCKQRVRITQLQKIDLVNSA